MRRDILEIDTAVSEYVQHGPLALQDLEAVRLLLSGGSVVDWQRMALRTIDDVDRFLLQHRIDISDSTDRERLRYVFNEAVAYLEEHMQLRFPKELRNPKDVRDVFLWASQFGGFRRTQILSCVVLKLMHVIQHMEAADLKFKLPISEQELFRMAHEDILEHFERMQNEGFPVVSFHGSRKSRSSVITKLIAKKENVAATIFDKLRFRIVVRDHQDLVPVLSWLTNSMIPFNYIIPGESHNNLLDPDELYRWLSEPDRLQAQALREEPEVAETGKNEFSGASYRMINFICDYPVRLDKSLPGAFPFELGKVVYVMVEFQVLDETTARMNQEGENAHHLYKQRQHQVVARRLKRGGRPSHD